VLMSTKDILDALKRYEQYKMIRTEKLKVLGELKHVADQLLVLNRKLRSKMPKSPVKIPDFHVGMREGEGKIITGPTPMTARPKSKLDVLQEELEKIEARLGALE